MSLAPLRRIAQSKATKNQQGKANTKSVQIEQQVHTAFVSRLSGELEVTDAEAYLRTEFQSFGIIVGIRVTRPTSSKKITMLVETNTNMWHAYVDFASAEALEACCVRTYSQSRFPFKVRPNLSASQRKEQSRLMIQEKRKVFLNGLSSEIVADDLEREMRHYGTVQDIEIIPKPEQGKKIAFIIFQEPFKGEEVAKQSPLNIRLANGGWLKVECQIALNPQQLHARKQNKPRKDSNDASTEDDDFQPTQEGQIVDKQAQLPLRYLAVSMSVADKKTADACSSIGPIGNKRPGPPQPKPCHRISQNWFLFGQPLRVHERVETRLVC